MYAILPGVVLIKHQMLMVYIMQAMVANGDNRSLETLLIPTREQLRSDQMILYVRAICAVGHLATPEEEHLDLAAKLAPEVASLSFG